MFDTFPTNPNPNPVVSPPAPLGQGAQDMFASVIPETNFNPSPSTQTPLVPATSYGETINKESGNVKFLIIGLVTLIIVLIVSAIAYQMVLKPKFQTNVVVDPIVNDVNDVTTNDTDLDSVDDLESEVLVTESADDLGDENSEFASSTVMIDTDMDQDGVSDDIELLKGTNPNNKDTDSDGLSDYEEVNVYKTNPLVADTDGDGLVDGEEVNVYKTDPLVADTDTDGLIDGEEIKIYKANPKAVDTDSDGYSDGEEVKNNYDPNGPGRLLITNIN